MSFDEDKACRYTLISEHDIKNSDISSEVELLLSSSFYSDGEGIYTYWKSFINDVNNPALKGEACKSLVDQP